MKLAPTPHTGGPRKPREGTKQQQVLALLRRTEGATVAQIAETTGWQAHTVRGFFAGLKKRQGIAVDAAERVRQVGLRIPTESSRPFRRKPAGDSDGNQPPIPRQSSHP